MKKIQIKKKEIDDYIKYIRKELYDKDGLNTKEQHGFIKITDMDALKEDLISFGYPPKGKILLAEVLIKFGLTGEARTILENIEENKLDEKSKKTLIFVKSSLESFQEQNNNQDDAR